MSHRTPPETFITTESMVTRKHHRSYKKTNHSTIGLFNLSSAYLHWFYLIQIFSRYTFFFYCSLSFFLTLLILSEGRNWLWLNGRSFLHLKIYEQAPETITALLIGYTPIQNVFGIKNIKLKKKYASKHGLRVFLSWSYYKTRQISLLEWI